MNHVEIINVIHQRRQGIDMVAMKYAQSTSYCTPDKPAIGTEVFNIDGEGFDFFVDADSFGRQEGRGEPNGQESQITTAR